MICTIISLQKKNSNIGLFYRCVKYNPPLINSSKHKIPCRYQKINTPQDVTVSITIMLYYTKYSNILQCTRMNRSRSSYHQSNNPCKRPKTIPRTFVRPGPSISGSFQFSATLGGFGNWYSTSIPFRALAWDVGIGVPRSSSSTTTQYLVRVWCARCIDLSESRPPTWPRSPMNFEKAAVYDGTPRGHNFPSRRYLSRPTMPHSVIHRMELCKRRNKYLSRGTSSTFGRISWRIPWQKGAAKKPHESRVRGTRVDNVTARQASREKSLSYGKRFSAAGSISLLLPLIRKRGTSALKTRALSEWRTYRWQRSSEPQFLYHRSFRRVPRRRRGGRFLFVYQTVHGECWVKWRVLSCSETNTIEIFNVAWSVVECGVYTGLIEKSWNLEC